MDKLLGGRLVIATGDITRLKVDAIVNAANSSLMGGGGVDGAIHRAGGPVILEACKKIRETEYPGGLPAGKAVVTGGGNLPAHFVIHAVGPIWRSGRNDEEKTLYSAYYNALSLCPPNTIKTIAFPAISTGVYGFPKKKAADVSFKAVRDFLEHNPLPEKVTFIFYSSLDKNIFLSSLDLGKGNN